MLLVQKFLETKSFYELEKEHGVYASFSKSGHKFSLNYDQIEARESDPLAQECRGLILSSEDGQPFFAASDFNNKEIKGKTVPGKTNILAYPMKRFFNYGQGSAAEIDWSDPNVSVMEKLDGTLIIVYFDKFKNDWCVATRSVSEADLPLDGAKYTFRTLFEKALNDAHQLSFEEFTFNLNKDVTYCYELTTPYNRVVVQYNTCFITLLAARSLLGDLKELDINHINTFGIPRVRSFSFSAINSIIDWVSNQNPLEYEGVVVRDPNFNRIKVKNAAYVAFSKARDVLGASDRNCLELILAEKEDDVLPALPPEIQDNLLKIKEGYRNWIRTQESMYEEIYAEASAIAPDKKTFAITLNKRKVNFPGVFFSIFDGKASSVKDFISKNRKDGSWPNSLLDKILESIA